jgi:hypothetical protein
MSAIWMDPRQVIPAKAGIQITVGLDSRFRGNDENKT